MSNDSEIIGFMDIGTNTINLMVVKFFPGTFGTPIFRDKETVKIGRELYRDGMISNDVIEKCRLITDRFTKVARDLGAKHVFALATCAARDATNKKELMDALKSKGLTLRVISGLEEARLIKLGVFGTKGPDERTILIDLGGGSTEVVLCEGTEDLYIDSLNIGSVRLAYELLDDQEKPVSKEDYDFIRHRVDISSYRAVSAIRTMGFTKAVGSSATMTLLADMCAARRDGDASFFTIDELIKLMSDLRSMNSSERAAVPKMNPLRADMIIAGGAIAEELMRTFGIKRMDVTEYGLREGMNLNYLLEKEKPIMDIRSSSVVSLGKSCSYDMCHAEYVKDKAFSIFDQFRELGLHKMDDSWRELMGHASELHDIGMLVNYTKHHILSYNIISNSDMLGFDDQELEVMSLMVKFHHKKFPTPNDRSLKEYDGDTDSVLKSALILRMADVTDRHRSHCVDSVFVYLSEDAVYMTLTSVSNVSMEKWSLESLSRDFERIFGKKLVVTTKSHRVFAKMSHDLSHGGTQ